MIRLSLRSRSYHGLFGHDGSFACTAFIPHYTPRMPEASCGGWGQDDMLRLLLEIEPLLRAHIRRRRSQRGPMLATSDIFASVVRRAVMNPSEAAHSADSARMHDLNHDPRTSIDSAGFRRQKGLNSPRELGEVSASRAADIPIHPTKSRRGDAINFVLTLADRALAFARRKERRERTTADAAALRGAIVKGEIDATASNGIAAIERFDVLRNLLEQADEIDRVIMRLRVSGAQWRVIAAETSTTEAACRQRWSRLLKRLAIQLSDD